MTASLLSDEKHRSFVRLMRASVWARIPTARAHRA